MAIHEGRFVEMTVYCIVSRAVPGYVGACMIEATVSNFVCVHAY